MVLLPDALLDEKQGNTGSPRRKAVDPLALGLVVLAVEALMLGGFMLGRWIVFHFWGHVLR